MAKAPPLDEMMLVRALVPRAVESTVVIGSSACQASGSEYSHACYAHCEASKGTYIANPRRTAGCRLIRSRPAQP